MKDELRGLIVQIGYKDFLVSRALQVVHDLLPDRLTLEEGDRPTGRVSWLEIIAHVRSANPVFGLACDELMRGVSQVKHDLIAHRREHDALRRKVEELEARLRGGGDVA